ncbi:hypothetical protein [Bathymodiolus platifrons methanotrophic gill symbiont]|uniref:hypothetical protein n=1 Tax=Bathymodiolus platifrons methanotrophic gill symbiont TaxID=113268 RepID=UPI001C8D3D76|nr:hypothetical protein [Bathymodiolus platifrons methanotrophic gill symbiont]
MKNVLIVALLFGWVSTSLAEGDSDIYMTMDGDGIEGSYPEYEDICEGEGVREPSMSDREYADFIIEFQKTECAFTFEVGGTGFGEELYSMLQTRVTMG